MGRNSGVDKTKVINADCTPVSGDNPFPTVDVDGNNRESLNTVFGDKIVGPRSISNAVQFQYGLESDDAETTIVSTGTVTLSDAMLIINTGTAADGSVLIQGTDYLRYLPGCEAFAFFTAVFTQGVADSVQRIGLFDEDGGNGNGFYVGYEGEQFGVTWRRAEVDTFYPIDVTTVFPEDEGVFDPTKGNVYKISYGYLGFATINYEVMTPCGCWTRLYSIKYPNSADVTHITNSFLPTRAEMTNAGNTTDLELRVGSIAIGVVNGGTIDAAAREFSQDVGPSTIAAATQTQIVHFRNKATYFGITNKIVSQLILISAATEGNKPVAWGLIKNCTVVTPGTWTDADVDSVIEYSTDEVVDLTTGKGLLFWNMAKADSFFEDVESYILTLKPNEYATFYALSSSTNDVSLSIRYKDLF